LGVSGSRGKAVKSFFGVLWGGVKFSFKFDKLMRVRRRFDLLDAECLNRTKVAESTGRQISGTNGPTETKKVKVRTWVTI